MNNFEFQNPTKLIFGKGTIAQLSDNLPKDVTIMVTYGGGSIKRNGVYDQVMAALEGFDYIEFSGIEPNPHYETLMKAVALAKEKNVGFFLAVGGGSTIDGTKFIAAAMGYPNDPWEFMYNPALLVGTTPTPLAAVLTLPATGSEMNPTAVITKDETKEKLAFAYEGCFPKFSVLDPQVCYSLPQKQVANGITDTFIHVVEQYITYPVQAYVQERWAEGILLTLKEIGAKAVANIQDYDLASNYMFAATMGLNKFISMGVPEDWATHQIGHELTAFHGIDHGRTLAVVAPSLYNVMRDEKREKLLQYGERVWGINAGDEDSRIDATIKSTRDFFESLGVKTHLSDYGVTEQDIERIVNRFKERGSKLGERGSITYETIDKILKGAM
ncbi:MAG: iron-containing alcohol dehydrogenase [Rikenellaceae bacterium]